MNPYTYYQQDTPRITQDAIVSGVVYTDSSLVDSDVYHNNNITTSQYVSDHEKPWVSPVTYDPTTGIYTQTFPEEYHDFLRKFGQYIEFPEDDSPPQQQYGWSYQDANGSNPEVEPPNGFKYNPETYQMQPPAPVYTPSLSSSLSDEDAALMREYIASPVLASPSPPHQRVNSAGVAVALDNMKPQLQQQSQAAYVSQQQPGAVYVSSTPVQNVKTEEIIQPHTIVPSQRPLDSYAADSHRHSAGFLYESSTGSWVMHLPHQEPSASEVCIPTPPIQLPSTPVQHRQRQPGTMASSTHSFHPASDVVSPASSAGSCESPNSDHRHHSHSSKTKHRTISRGWSSSRRSRSPNASTHSMRLSPLPFSQRAAAIMEKKPPLACLFCRGRKIACGPSPPGRTDNACNQCARRRLKCEYPTESRRGMRRRKAEKAEKAEQAEKVKVALSRKRATRLVPTPSS